MNNPTRAKILGLSLALCVATGATALAPATTSAYRSSSYDDNGYYEEHYYDDNDNYNNSGTYDDSYGSNTYDDYNGSHEPDGEYYYENEYEDGFYLAIMHGFTIALIIYLVLTLPIIIGHWKVFEKAGRSGWISLIPFYSDYTLAEIGGIEGWIALIPYFLLIFGPLSSISSLIINIIVCSEVSKSFGKSAGFTCGLIFLPIIFWPILGLGRSSYLGKVPEPIHNNVSTYGQPTVASMTPANTESELKLHPQPTTTMPNGKTFSASAIYPTASDPAAGMEPVIHPGQTPHQPTPPAATMPVAHPKHSKPIDPWLQD